MDEPQVPPEERAPAGPKIGVDEWVAQVERRRERKPWLERLVDGVPPLARPLVLVAISAPLPFVLSEGDLFRYGVFTLLYALLALGLNVVVGFAGLLDLGYVALFGFGSYFYSILSSDHLGIHWPAQASIPVVVAGSALLGLALGLTSRRLLGDYLAIVTLFFGQAFVVFVNTSNPKGLTGGPNGIPDVDPLRFFAWEVTTTRGYFFVLLGVVVAVAAALYFAAESRTGRAWKALREDPLAAEAMGIPVNRLKLLAFAFGASIAGLAGCIFAAFQTGAFSGNYTVSLLILVYAVVILGGAGSLTGVVIGAVIINVTAEVLTPATPNVARWLFYGTIVLLLLARMRPWYRPVLVLGLTAALGFLVHGVGGALWDSATRGSAESGGFLAGAIERWVLLPANRGAVGDYAYVALVLAVVLLLRVRGWWRVALLAPSLYLTAFVWENLMVLQPAPTRFVLFGALLVVLMQARPQGMLGTARVEIV
jgi:branched-chain amino acid transport system permease protein